MTTYPPNLLNIIKSTHAPAFSQTFEPSSPMDCLNCAGMGKVYVFIAESGPFRDPPGIAKADSVAKSVDDQMYGWVWYVGKTIGGECPVCRGMGRQPKPTAGYNTVQPIKRLAEGLKHVVPVVGEVEA